jgi:hypothetical protein
MAEPGKITELFQMPKGGPEAEMTMGGIRMADRRWHFEKHASFGRWELKKGTFVRVWGSQPMTCDLKTGALTGHPHDEYGNPEWKPDYKQAYGR